MKVNHRYFLRRAQEPEREVHGDEYLLAQYAVGITASQEIAFDVRGLVGRIKTEIEE